MLLDVRIEKKLFLINHFGVGPTPIIIVGHAEIYAPLLQKAFTTNDLLNKYKFFAPSTYWCKGAPLYNLPRDKIEELTLKDLVGHLEQIRVSLNNQGILASTNGKIGLYAHSGFSALAFQYATSFPDNTLFLELEGPTPFFTEQWVIEKERFFHAHASKTRKSALQANGLKDGGDSAVDEVAMRSFESFKDGYHKMNTLLWYDYKTDHKDKVWGDHILNMTLMSHFFFSLLAGYDCRQVIDRVKCPIHLSLGIYDAAVPYYLWTGVAEDGGVGFLDKPGRDYTLFARSGHWPATEEPEKYALAFDQFVGRCVLG